MSNAPGYRRNQREEIISEEAQDRMVDEYGMTRESSLDPNRDFPFDQNSPHDCLNTIIGRINFRLLTENNIDASITFHGGINMLAIPYGCYSRSVY